MDQVLNHSKRVTNFTHSLAQFLFFLFLFLLVGSAPLFAQSGLTQMSPGLAGERDARGRNPELFVTRVVREDRVSLLVDAHVPHHDYQQYPIKFEFYINRHFFTSQIRSQELPGPVGVDIGPDLATPPFNYAVIAYVLHPTRSTHSMVTGAVFTNELSALFSCESDVGIALFGDDAVKTYSATEVSINQTGNNQIGLDFEARATDESKITISGTLNLEESTLSGVLSVSSDGSERLVTVTGQGILDNNTLTSLDVASADTQFDLRCD